MVISFQYKKYCNHVTLPDDIINVSWYSFPKFKNVLGISRINIKSCIIKSEIIRTFEEIRDAIRVAKNAVNFVRNTSPVFVNWSWIVVVNVMQCLVVSIIIFSRKEVDKSITPSKNWVNVTRSCSKKVKGSVYFWFCNPFLRDISC